MDNPSNYTEREKEHLDDLQINMSRINKDTKNLYKIYIKNHETFHHFFTWVKAEINTMNQSLQAFSKNHKSRIRREREKIQTQLRKVKREEKTQSK